MHTLSPDRGPGAPRIAAIVLAAGRSSRMAGTHKLLLELDGVPLLARAVDAVLESAVAQLVLVVLGHRSAAVRTALGVREVRTVYAEGAADGLAASLRAGLQDLPGGLDAVLVALGDMPLVRPGTIRALADTFSQSRLESPIIVPKHDGRLGNPVLWHATHVASLKALTGDRGGRAVLENSPGQVVVVPTDDPGVLIDVDVVADLARAASMLTR